MSRVIKFRAWHHGYDRPTVKTPIKPVMLYEDHVGQCLTWLHQGQPLDVMQFTGLLDHNGKEIYEGDVLRWYVNDVTRVGIIDYLPNSGGYDMKNLHDDYHVCNDFLRGEYEIIGNIYENPELLEVRP